ncbi:MAG: inositol monophosphatase [Alphaproteobacteria bacterium]|nr:inositol monophosphatase [Alphaproteobacteria bacterium]
MSKRGVEERYLAACAIAREAGDLMRRLYEKRETGSYKLKGHQDYLTEADGEVEKLIVRRIGEAFPGDSVFGEEGGGKFGARAWVIDPIDGTANFARGIPHFCVSIAYVQDNAITVGALCNPMLGELFAAKAGGGATLNGRPMKVSKTRDMRSATVELGWSMRRPMEDYVAMVTRVVKEGAGIRRSGSGALGLAYVADGRTDAYAELHINSWDCLAGILMVNEAGGWTNDFLAGNGLTKGNPILASNAALRRAIIKATGIG